MCFHFMKLIQVFQLKLAKKKKKLVIQLIVVFVVAMVAVVGVQKPLDWI